MVNKVKFKLVIKFKKLKLEFQVNKIPVEMLLFSQVKVYGVTD